MQTTKHTELEADISQIKYEIERIKKAAETKKERFDSPN